MVPLIILPEMDEREAESQVAELDEDVEPSQEEEEAGQSEPPDWLTRVEKYERSIFELHRRWKQNRLDLQADFQRKFVWDKHKKERLVESVLAKVPLPAIYLSEEAEDLSIVIDGQQRLTTLFHYLDGKFALGSAQLLGSGLKHKRFSELPALMQRRFEDSPLTCFIVQRGSDPRFKFELFERLNQGAVVLHPQEIRNAVYRGPGLEALKLFASDNPDFQRLVRKRRNLSRFRDHELVLRGVAFILLGVHQYTGNLKRFLNRALDQLNRSSESVIFRTVAQLSSALQAARESLGDSAFDNPHSARLNAPVFDAIIAGFAQAQDLQPWAQRSLRLKTALSKLWSQQDFISSVTAATDRTENVLRRFAAWQDVLRVEKAEPPPCDETGSIP